MLLQALQLFRRSPSKTLFLRMLRNRLRVPSASGFTEQWAVIRAIFGAPAGSVVECGTYLGGSAVNLSQACMLTGRQFFIFDSFEGLPEPTTQDRDHFVLSSSDIHQYRRGAWKGPLETVQENLKRYGQIGVCNLKKGYLADTLPEFSSPVAVAFCDVDLVESLKTCVRYLWPCMVDGGYFFTHEADHLSIAKLFYDDNWWRDNVACDAPGLIGAGSGLGLSRKPDGTYGSCIGYTVKNPTPKALWNETGMDRRPIADCSLQRSAGCH
jgi:O-methyltransferase